MKNQYMVIVVSLLVVVTIATTSYATDYTWTGAVDGEWTNTANWVGGNIPVDADDVGPWAAGLSFAVGSGDKVIFSGSIAPTSNVPEIAGGYEPEVTYRSDTPIMEFNSGGTFNFPLVGREEAIWFNTQGTQTVWTVGDGIGANDVTVNITAATKPSHLLARTPGTNTYVVNSDGALTFSKSLDLQYGTDNSRNAKFTIAGGAVTTSGSLIDMSDGLRYVEFTAAGGSFTAMYGGDYADYAAISNAVASNLAWEVGEGIMLEAADNTTTFTVSSLPIPPKATAIMIQ